MKIKGNVLAALICFLAAIAIFPKMARGQDQQSQDPPSLVARLGYVEGSVSFQPAGEQDWVQAEPDRPMTTGDSLWADQNSRGEVHVGGTALWLGAQTGISFLNLNDQAVQVQVAQGSVAVHVRQINQGEAYEIDSPNLAFSILSPGDYRLDVDPNGSTTNVSVYSGQGTVTGGGQTWNIAPGQRATFAGADQLSYNAGPITNDTFYSWARAREMREEHLESLRYVSPDVTGYEDLDQYGSWHNDPTYGAYWAPNNVDADWAPYHEGSWAWVAPWGWTWVDTDPWGFAPFHYGRWAMFGNTWGWVPGPAAQTQVVYAPALVGFVGGGGFGVPIGFGAGTGVAWFPLGPRDVYVPAYQVSQRYVEQINVSNTTVINRTTVVNVYNNYTVNHVTNINYTYANNTRAVMACNQQAFVSGMPVTKGAIRVTAAEIQHPRVVTTAALTPTRASVVGTVATAHAVPPKTIENRKLVTKLAPAPQATSFGKPRPQVNPNLSASVVNRAGFSREAQTTRAVAVSKAETAPAANRPAPAAQPNQPAPNQPRPNANPNEAKPNEARPNEAQPNRPATPPSNARPAQPPPNEARPPEAQPKRPATPPNENRQPEAQPNRPATPPNNARPAQPPPNAARPPEAQPKRPATPPNENRQPEAQPNRPATPPNERKPQAEKPVTPPKPQEHPATPPKEEQKPPKEQPKPSEKPKEPPKKPEPPQS
jgi:hypothetical protein